MDNLTKRMIRWSEWVPGRLIPISEQDIQDMAAILSQYPNYTFAEACTDLHIPEEAQHVVWNMYGAEILGRAKRMRITRTELSVDEIKQISVNFLVTTIDNDSASVKDRLKAVETIAKLIELSRDDKPEGEQKHVSSLIGEIRRKVLGVGADDSND